MTARGRRKGRRDQTRKEETLLEALSRVLSEEEIQRVLAGALLELDRAGRRRLAERLDEDTAAALRQALEPGTKEPRPGARKVLQEWERAWSDWESCVFESTIEDGRYVVQDNDWEPPFLDGQSLASDLEPIAARMRKLLPRVVDEEIAPECSFREALEETAQEFGSGLPDWIVDPEGCHFGPQVTGCLLQWEWRAGRREGRDPFEIVDAICRLEASLEDASLDAETIVGFVLDLGEAEQMVILGGITDHRETGPWPQVLGRVYSGWFALHQELARRWDAERFLAVCLANIEQSWELALPPARDLLRRKAFREARSLIEKAVAAMLHLRPGESWDPRQGLLIQHPMHRYDVGSTTTRRQLLEAWRKAALGLGEEDVASALRLQAKLLAQWKDWDAALEAFREAEGSACAPACERLFADWRRRVAEEIAGTAEGWVPGLIDGARADDAAVFRRAVRGWLKEIESAGDLGGSLHPLGELSLVLDPGGELKRASPALHALLSRGSKRKGKLAESARRWVRRFQGEELLPEVLGFWKRNAASLVPDPAHVHGSDYTRCAEWLAAVLDLDRRSYRRILRDWSVKHRRRRNLWRALEKRRLPLDAQG